MTKEQEDIFSTYCYSYADRFIYTVCADTPTKWLKKMCTFKWWRVQMELEDKHNIVIDDNDRKHYNIYEKIMIEVLSKRIEQCKIEQIEKEKKAKENKKK